MVGSSAGMLGTGTVLGDTSQGVASGSVPGGGMQSGSARPMGGRLESPGSSLGADAGSGSGVASDGNIPKGDSAVERMEAHAAWPMISRLSVTLVASVPMSRFRVRNLLGLACGQTIVSSVSATEDVPLMAGELHVGWSEFEVVDQKLALRVTRLA